MWIIGLNYLLGWEPFSLFGHRGYVKNSKLSNDNFFLLCRLSTGARYTSFVVVSIACGALWYVDGYVNMLEGYCKGYLYPILIVALSTDWSSITIWAAVCILVMQKPDVMPKPFKWNVIYWEKKSQTTCRWMTSCIHSLQTQTVTRR
jgi:hypothetical protein